MTKKGTTNASPTDATASQTTTAQAGAEAATSQATTATTADAVAVVSAAPAEAPTAPDENHGRGGHYRLVNGKRERVGGTKPEADQAKPAKAAKA